MRQRGKIIFLAAISAAFFSQLSYALDARPLCSPEVFRDVSRSVAQMASRIDYDFKPKIVPFPVKDRVPLAKVFVERFQMIEKSVFGKNGIFDIAGTNLDPELGVSFRREFGIVVNAKMARAILKKRPQDTQLIDLVIAHELGHYVQDIFAEKEQKVLALANLSDSVFEMPEAARKILRKNKLELGHLQAEDQEVARAGIIHAETSFIGLAILSRAGLLVGPEAARDLEKLRRDYTKKHPAQGVSPAQMELLDNVEFSLLPCSAEAARSSAPKQPPAENP